MSSKATCLTCRFYLDAGVKTAQGHGHCRRYPKPLATVDYHWCGEHRPIFTPPPLVAERKEQ